MKTGLDQIKSTITLSLGTKNRLREIKGSQSYEDFINYLVRLRNKSVHNLDNTIELQNIERKKAIYRLEMGGIVGNSPEFYTILFSYNPYNYSQNFWFDIKLEVIRDTGGRKMSISEFIKEMYLDNNQNLMNEYKLYFSLLETAIQKEIEPLFHHKGRIEDYSLWEKEFEMLTLSKKSFEEDVMDRLKDFKSGTGVFLDRFSRT